MSRIKVLSAAKLVLLGLLAAVAVSAMGAASAPAEQVYFCLKVTAPSGPFKTSLCQEEGAPNEYAWAQPGGGGKLIFCLAKTGTFKDSLCSKAGVAPQPFSEFQSTENTPRLLGTSGTSILKGELGGAKAEITCALDVFETRPEPNEKSIEGKIQYSKCIVVKPANCTVKEPIIAEFTDKLELMEPGKELLDVFEGSGKEKTFAELAFEGEKCSLKGLKFPVKGIQKTEFDATIHQAKEKHEVIAKATGSELTLGGNKATYEGTAKVHAEGFSAWLIN